jgi:hypothetical protein
MDSIRDCLSALQSDADGKDITLKVDTACTQLRALPTGTVAPFERPSVITIGRKFTDVFELNDDEKKWQSESVHLIACAEGLQKDAHGIVNRASDELAYQKNHAEQLAKATALALHTKQQRTSQLVLKLSHRLRLLDKEIRGIDERISISERDANNAEKELQLVDSQLAMRSSTLPDREKNVRDNLCESLVSEQTELEATLQRLKDLLHTLTSSRKKLLAMRKDVWRDLQGKSLNLKLDVACLGETHTTPLSSTPLLEQQQQSLNAAMIKRVLYRRSPRRKAKRSSSSIVCNFSTQETLPDIHSSSP